MYVCICLSARTSQNHMFKLSVNVTYDRGLSFSDDTAVIMLSTSSFMNDVMFSHNGAYTVHMPTNGLCVYSPSVTPLQARRSLLSSIALFLNA